MTITRIEIKPLAINMNGPLALGTGFRRGLIHRTIERDDDSSIYIPASSLKGRVRSACEQIAHHFGLQICQSPYTGDMCSAHRKACLVCRVFGTPGRADTLHWHNAKLQDDYRRAFAANPAAQAYSRTQVKISRSMGTAASDHLFTGEYAIEDLCFESKLVGYLEVTPIEGDSSIGGYELLLLLAGLRLVNAIGGSASRGAARCNISLPNKIIVGEKSICWKDIIKNIDNLNKYEGGDQKW